MLDVKRIVKDELKNIKYHWLIEIYISRIQTTLRLTPLGQKILIQFLSGHFTYVI